MFLDSYANGVNAATVMATRLLAQVLFGALLIGQATQQRLIEPFELSAVRLGDETEQQRASALNLEYLFQLDPDRLLWTFRNNAGELHAWPLSPCRLSTLQAAGWWQRRQYKAHGGRHGVGPASMQGTPGIACWRHFILAAAPAQACLPPSCPTRWVNLDAARASSCKGQSAQKQPGLLPWTLVHLMSKRRGHWLFVHAPPPQPCYTP